jgi:PQQ-dependent dehydrogenase (methanol/ethanol family)
VQTARPGAGETLPGAPLVAGGRVFVGSGGEDFGVRGWIEALDAETGRTLWRRYNTGPDGEVGVGPGGARDLGVTTWPPDAWQSGGGGATGLTFDRALGLLFHSTGHPAPWNPDQRQGENRWTSGLFARDPATGAARWFLPVNPHDLYALGAGPSNLLADISGRQLLIHPDGNGRVYVVDPTDGRLASAEAFVPTNATSGVDLATRTLLREDAKNVNPNATTRNICPGWPGATGPGAAAFSPATKLLYIPANLLCMDMEARNASFMSGTPFIGANLRMKAQAGQRRGALIAWDVAAAKAAWTAPEAFPLAGGVLATAGGLVFYGTLDGWLKAVDARTGKPLWQARTASGVIGTPTAFAGADGRQYVAVLAGIGGIGRVAWKDIDVRDATAGNGYANALRDLPEQKAPGGALHLFALPP